MSGLYVYNSIWTLIDPHSVAISSIDFNAIFKLAPYWRVRLMIVSRFFDVGRVKDASAAMGAEGIINVIKQLLLFLFALVVLFTFSDSCFYHVNFEFHIV